MSRGFNGTGGFRGGGFRGGFGSFNAGPPETVKELGHFVHPCHDDLVCKVILDDVPFFNAPIYLENKQQIGKIDEIFGPIRDYFVSVKLADDVKASSFAKDQKLYIDPAKLMPLKRFLPGANPPQGRGRGRGGSGGRGGRGGFGGRGGRGGFGGRGGRGGFGGRGGGFGGQGGGFGDRRGGSGDRRGGSGGRGGGSGGRGGGSGGRGGGFGGRGGGFGGRGGRGH